MLALPLVVVLSGCGATRTSDGAYQRLDAATEYRIDSAADGFTAHVVYTEKQFVPRQSMVVESAVRAARQVAQRHAAAEGRELQPISDDDARYHVDRNGVTGRTSVAVALDARWK